ncbi:hypothetical protein TSUD_134670 [Trifolium subterraneum]|uniref:Uncharacterized protein n=1 Tax=Trifolium subterraneum TaxID=3900 RepID=A0A2Z6NX11_TRISU|nr:hypothetical protein TSUD_134670 [Trifolium subterraneum]
MPTQASQTNVVAVANVVEVPVAAPKKRGRPRKAQTETNKPKKSKNVESANVDSDAPIIAETTHAADGDNVADVASILLGEDIDFAFNYDTVSNEFEANIVNEPMVPSQEVDDVIAKLKKSADTVDVVGNLIKGLKSMPPKNFDNTMIEVLTSLAASKYNVSKPSVSEPVKRAKNSPIIDAKNILKGLKTLPPNELDETVKELITRLVKWHEGVGKGDVPEN